MRIEFTLLCIYSPCPWQQQEARHFFYSFHTPASQSFGGALPYYLTTTFWTLFHPVFIFFVFSPHDGWPLGRMRGVERQGDDLLRAMANSNNVKRTGGEETCGCPWTSPRGEIPGATPTHTHTKTRMKTL